MQKLRVWRTIGALLALGFSSIGLAQLPPGFVDLKVASGWDQVTGICFPPTGGPDLRLFVWEKHGQVWIVENGVRDSVPVVDIREEVGSWVDHGLVGFTVDPNFWTNGYIYLFYCVDYHYLKYFGTGQYNPNSTITDHDTIGRITRYTCTSASGFRVADPASRLILLGESMSTGVPILAVSHGVGSLVFGADGMLLASCGDGASHEVLDDGGPRPNSSNTGLADGIISTKQDVGAFRSQLIDSVSGKILRLNPATGDGVPSNPYYNAGAPRSAKSRVWALGLRNPYRMNIRPGTGNPDPAAADPGVIYLGDVGLEDFEEMDVCTGPGQNFGWPMYEGLEPGPSFNQGYSTSNTVNLDAPNPLAGGGCPQNFYFRQLVIQDTLAPTFPNPCNAGVQIPASVPHWVHRRPVAEWNHEGAVPARVPIYSGNNAATADIGGPGSPVQGPQFLGNCSTGGMWYTGTSFPAQYQNVYFHGDFGARWIRGFRFTAGNAPYEEFEFLPTGSARVVCIRMHPTTGDLYYVQYEADQFNRAEVHRVIYVGNGNLPPNAVATSDVTYGPAPLTVHFTGSASSDPEGLPLTYSWDFGDGTPKSKSANPTHVYTNDIDITSQGTITAKIFGYDPPFPTGQGNKDPETIRDSDIPPVGNQEWARQYDTFHDGAQGVDDWVGYTFASSKTISGLVFQEGLFDDRGGWFNSVHVEVKIGGNWQNTTGNTVTPAYAGNNGISYETFTFRFNPVSATGVRIRGNTGGDYDYLSIGELRVISPAPQGTNPCCHTATLTVTDDAGATASADVIISPNNSPPVVTITSPAPGTLFPTAYASQLPLQATISDPKFPNNQLTCRWQTIIRHNNHNHPEPPVLACESVATVGPHGDNCGDFYYEFDLMVSDPLCLSTGVFVIMYPNCCKPDFNNDGFLDPLDYNGYINAFEASEQMADYNNDTFIDPLDYNAFINDFEAGCP